MRLSRITADEAAQSPIFRRRGLSPRNPDSQYRPTEHEHDSQIARDYSPPAAYEHPPPEHQEDVFPDQAVRTPRQSEQLPLRHERSPASSPRPHDVPRMRLQSRRREDSLDESHSVV